MHNIEHCHTVRIPERKNIHSNILSSNQSQSAKQILPPPWNDNCRLAHVHCDAPNNLVRNSYSCRKLLSPEKKRKGNKRHFAFATLAPERYKEKMPWGIASKVWLHYWQRNDLQEKIAHSRQNANCSDIAWTKHSILST